MKVHIQIATLALLLKRMLERRLREAGEGLPGSAALRVPQTVQLVEFEGGRGRAAALGYVQLGPRAAGAAAPQYPLPRSLCGNKLKIKILTSKGERRR